MIHPSADVSPNAQIGQGTRIWNEAQVGERARVGSDCRLGKGVFIDHDVVLGNRVKIQNRASIYHGVTIEDGVFVGPHVSFTNDRYPRAVLPDGTPRTEKDWTVIPTYVREGASIGAGAVIICGVTIGRWAMVGAGSLVAQDVPDHGLVFGNPAALMGWACVCGRRLARGKNSWDCPACNRSFEFEREPVAP